MTSRSGLKKTMKFARFRLKTMMKMNMKMYRNLYKDGYIFMLSLYTDKMFRVVLLSLQGKWKSPYTKKPAGYAWECKSYREVRKKNNVAYKQRKIFLESLQAEKRTEFFKDINKFLSTFNLGEEWLITITDYTISAWLSPPIYNLHTKEIGQSGKKRLVLILNPDTSIDDIKEAWWLIDKKQKELWPNFERPNFSIKSFRNLFIAIQDLQERSKRSDTIESQKDKDLDIVVKIWTDAEDDSTAADKKRRSNLRQIRSRLKRKIV